MKLTFVNYSFAGTAHHFNVTGRQLIGGGEVFLHDLCKVLDKKGFECSVLQGGASNDNFEYDGIPVKQIATRGRYWFNFDWPRAVKDAGYVHLHDANHAFPFSYGNSATFHGVSWDVPYEGNNPLAYIDWLARYKFFKLLIHHAIRHCSSIVSVDSVLLRYVQSQYPSEREKIVVIPNYVDLKAFKPTKEKKKDKFVVLFPRNLTKSRGTWLMLDAMQKIDDDEIEMWVAGTGAGQNAVKEAAQKDGRIKFLGHKDHYKDLPKLYNQSDLVIIPSLGVEGTSLSCLEAMACGKPVVASNVGGILDIIENGENGHLINPNSEELAQAIRIMKKNDSLRKSIAAKARKRAQEFSFDKWAKSWSAYAQETFR